MTRSSFPPFSRSSGGIAGSPFAASIAARRRPRRYRLSRRERLLSLPKGGPRIHALAIYLKTRQALSYARLQQAFFDLFGLTISQGALMNMFARTARAFEEKKEQALAVLRKASFVASDAGVRIEGVNACHWVFCCKSAAVHMAGFTRSAGAVRKIMNGHQPRVWTSGRYSAQQRHGTLHQTCLAHLARDAAYGLEASKDPVPLRLKLWFGRVFAFAADLAGMAQSALRAKKRELERQIGDMLMASTSCSIARELIGKIARAMRAAEYETAVQSAVDTARLAGAGSFQTILKIIARLRRQCAMRMGVGNYRHPKLR